VFEYPELHDESIAASNFLRHLNKLLQATGVKDFSMKVLIPSLLRKVIDTMPQQGDNAFDISHPGMHTVQIGNAGNEVGERGSRSTKRSGCQARMHEELQTRMLLCPDNTLFKNAANSWCDGSALLHMLNAQHVSPSHGFQRKVAVP
jgi:hypothetical protein